LWRYYVAVVSLNGWRNTPFPFYLFGEREEGNGEEEDRMKIPNFYCLRG